MSPRFLSTTNATATTIHYIASFLLAALGSNALPSAKDITKILGSVGINADDDWFNKVLSELKGRNIKDVVAQGISKLDSEQRGGTVAESAAPGAVEPAAAMVPKAVEQKKQKKKESEELDNDMGFGLLD
ncbi:60S acidic ribosomal protein P2-like [Ochotona curzoniae]|uniref:60S acidic ribosomal protein P2-like n=1 Tax=Ochotona curzoniae TaxID=130825 RepID=UPI001B3535B7|nr:60S acidic ribosomal protein P2-like [Ochotona curzoniae]